MLGKNKEIDVRFNVLVDLVRKIDQEKLEDAQQILTAFGHLDPNKNPIDLKFWIFLQPLLKHINNKINNKKNSAGWDNLYLSEHDVDQIRLFDLMANKMPMVSYAGHIANNLIYRAIKDYDSATILDIGIGSGQQMVKLIHKLGKNASNIKMLNFLGVEPAQKSLDSAQKAIKECSDFYQIKINFIAINKCIENFDDNDWKIIRAHSQKLIINEAFALHHVKNQSSFEDQKNKTLKRLKDLKPKLFVLSEPNSDHHTVNFVQRFLNCWHHFGLVFDVIDMLDIYPEEKQAIKLRFFAREIEDILSTDESSRSERHESAQMWLARLKLAGFRISEIASASIRKQQDWLEIFNNKNYFGVGIKSEPLVAIMAVY